MINSNKHTCPYNKEVVCEVKVKPCALCGWNPLVAKVRLERIVNARAASKTDKKQ